MTTPPTKSLLAGALGAALLAAGLGGCGNDQEPQGERYRIALVMKALSNEFFKTMEEGAKAHQQKNQDRYELIAVGIDDERNVTQQVNRVEEMLATGVDAIVIAPADSRTLVSVCKKAAEQGVVVVNIDNKLDAEALREAGLEVPFVGPDNQKGARLAGEYLAQFLEPGDKVARVEGMPGAHNAEMRNLGFRDAMDAAGVEIALSQSGNWEMAVAEEVVSAMLRKPYDLKAILCANDSMAIGAVTALKDLEKQPGDIYVVGYDNLSAVQEYIRQGWVLCTVDQHADRIAIEGITIALDLLEKKEAPKYKETPVDLVTAEDLKEGHGE
ncbi:MAG: sugar ABC transporter substrate-binding protein [Candidatus Brocadiia bacterium]